MSNIEKEYLKEMEKSNYSLDDEHVLQILEIALEHRKHN